MTEYQRDLLIKLWGYGSRILTYMVFMAMTLFVLHIQGCIAFWFMIYEGR